MDDWIISLFCLCDDLLKAIDHHEDPQCRMSDAVFSIDTFPIAVCDNIRIRRSRLYKNEAYRGYIASKKRYFYGLKLHMMVTQDGKPVEFFLTPGSFSDVKGLELFDFDPQ